ncbi:MAG TPA: FtsW/RodA/SpoVE family cell cycle protein, partial [Anaerolineales bacterium]|nr:FtsW/RodA/SpoVE family cell cycle protein [Anaerolineales bacterium]
MGTRTFVNNRMSLAPAKRSLSRGFDMPLVLAVIALVVFGLIMLYSASYDFSFNEYGTPSYMFLRQVRWLALGVILAFLLSLFDYHHWRRVVLIAMLGTIGLLITVSIINEIRLGASRTLYQGSYQPSEVAKLVSVIYLSVWLYSKRQFLHDIGFGLI